MAKRNERAPERMLLKFSQDIYKEIWESKGVHMHYRGAIKKLKTKILQKAGAYTASDFERKLKKGKSLVLEELRTKNPPCDKSARL